MLTTRACDLHTGPRHAVHPSASVCMAIFDNSCSHLPKPREDGSYMHSDHTCCRLPAHVVVALHNIHKYPAGLPFAQQPHFFFSCSRPETPFTWRLICTIWFCFMLTRLEENHIHLLITSSRCIQSSYTGCLDPKLDESWLFGRRPFRI